jgi:predicted TIM-barrel fold metal-dependent hydrolase
MAAYGQKIGREAGMAESGPWGGMIDVHAHYLPPAYSDALREAGVTALDGGIPVPQWRVEDSLAMMDRLGVATQLLSVSSPSVQFVRGPAAVRLARAVNEAGAGYVRAHPGRFGLFATLPLEDIAASLAEIDFAFERLGADGVVVMTNAHGIYLGDQRLDPVFDALNRRQAVVFLHPTSPACFEALSLGRPAPMIEFPFDTTRAAVNLVLSGTTRRCPGIKFILPHAGGTLPFLVQRIIGGLGRLGGGIDPKEALAEMRRFYCDTAGAANAHAVPALRELVPVTQILFGGDFPFTPEPAVARYVAFLRGSGLLTDEERAAVARGNALGLFPRLARGGGD